MACTPPVYFCSLISDMCFSDSDHLPSTGVKAFSNWPTIPQVYFNGEFVGGCDILLQMHQNGDLVEELKKLGIHSALLDAEKESK